MFPTREEYIAELSRRVEEDILNLAQLREACNDEYFDNVTADCSLVGDVFTLQLEVNDEWHTGYIKSGHLDQVQLLFDLRSPRILKLKHLLATQQSFILLQYEHIERLELKLIKYNSSSLKTADKNV